LFTALAIAIAVLVVLYHRRQKKQMLDNMTMRQTFEKHLLQSQLETQAQSFKYFSEEIHDNVGQVLSVIGMHLYRLQSEYTTDQAARLIEESSGLLNKAITDLRTITHTLGAQHISKKGFIEAIKAEVEYINAARAAICSLEILGEPVDMTHEWQTLLFRIIQEAVANALQHARASSILIRLRYNSNMLTASVIDNGKGFDPVTSAPQNSGLENMRLRAKLLGGNLHLASDEGKGTVLSLSIAINAS
jgi:signal transduction histidine kinase